MEKESKPYFGVKQFFITPSFLFSLKRKGKIKWSDLILAIFLFECSETNASTNELAEYLGMHRRTIRRSLIRLVELKIIIRTKIDGDLRQLKQFNYNLLSNIKFLREASNFAKNRWGSPDPQGTFDPLTTNIYIRGNRKSRIGTRKRIDLDLEIEDRDKKKVVMSVKKFGTEKRQQKLKELLMNEYRSKHKMKSWDESSEEAKEIVEFWNDLKCGVVHNYKKSKTLESLLYFIDTRLLRRYDVSEIVHAMKTFNELQKYPRNYGIPKTKLSLETFLKGNTYLDKQNKKNGYRAKVPFFDQIRHYGLKPESQRVLDLTTEFKEQYAKRVLGKQLEEVRFTPNQERDFLLAAKKLFSFYKDETVIRKNVDGVTIEFFVPLVFKALKAQYKNSMINTSNLRSDLTYSDILMKYIAQEFGTVGKDQPQYEFVKGE